MVASYDASSRGEQSDVSVVGRVARKGWGLSPGKPSYRPHIPIDNPEGTHQGAIHGELDPSPRGQ
ncbi:hypothetical protein [Polyangium sorediatum]|uniref:Uncharacterized protein n=1 Tax=Polyangium sorediatum TaxID=889274 RepID=A0ABT6PAS9_9BACT|nr:hypothetical protein [Polyangium sorediatum]MDI1437619.1 hypothetical protein [Polyangium sorediatum]